MLCFFVLPALLINMSIFSSFSSNIVAQALTDSSDERSSLYTSTYKKLLDLRPCF